MLSELSRPVIAVIGHRGAAGIEPENTLRSFRRACELRVDRVETDIHVTRDGVPVCIHDAAVDRTTDGSGPVREFSLEELRKLDAGQGERIPTLEEALQEMRGKTVLEIELKASDSAGPTVDVLEAAGVSPDEFIVISFDAAKLRTVRDRRPDVSVGLIATVPPEDFIQQAVGVGARYVAVYFACVTPDLVEAAHSAGMKIHGWTPDTQEQMTPLLELGLDGITSNRPDILIEVLRERGLR